MNICLRSRQYNMEIPIWQDGHGRKRKTGLYKQTDLSIEFLFVTELLKSLGIIVCCLRIGRVGSLFVRVRY